MINYLAFHMLVSSICSSLAVNVNAAWVECIHFFLSDILKVLIMYSITCWLIYLYI